MAEMTDRINSPHYHRNIEPIKTVVLAHLTEPRASVLEIGSGSGQHVNALALQSPQAVFTPSDPSNKHRLSIQAWTRHLKLENVTTPLSIDASTPEWFDDNDPDRAASFDLLLCFNVIHISPFEVTAGLLAGAEKYLKPGGCLILYGPFKQDGAHTAHSNAAFDQALQAQNPQWGVRDIGDVRRIAAQHRLELEVLEQVPANNFMPVFVKRDEPLL